ncbi:MAG: class II aldolase/adducin family protein [Dehalococcoidia bacterium]|nr:class II aldolase/adducin family protein [Dehalococcoidia bacterium]
MKQEFEDERREVLSAVERIADAGLVAGSSGNVSRRITTPDGDLIAITASSVPYHRFTLADVLVVDFDIEPVVGDGIPSSESLTHVAMYRERPDVGAVVHTHSLHASAFAVAGKPIPAVLDEQVVILGGAIEVAAYASSASEELARRAVEALGERAAVLLRQHGVVGVGRQLEEAVAVVELVERVAQVQALAGMLGGAVELPAEVVARERQVYRMLHGFGPE